MKRPLGLIIVTLLFALSSFAQTGPAAKTATPDKPAAAAASTAPLDLAKATVAAHGGEKLKNLKSLVTKGSADLTFMGQALPGAFSTAFSGDKYYFEITSAVQSIKQIFDGRDTYSSLPGFTLPPMTSLGFPLLVRVGDAGYVVTAIPNDKKKRKGFRVSTPEGFYTDFFIDEKTGQIKSYESSYATSGGTASTSVEIDEYQTVEGIVVPKRYSQRLDLGQITAYANFKVKTILVNSAIEADAFAISR